MTFKKRGLFTILLLVCLLILVGCGGGSKGGGSEEPLNFTGDNFDSYNVGVWVPTNGWVSDHDKQWSLVTGSSYSGGALCYDGTGVDILYHDINKADYTFSVKVRMPSVPWPEGDNFGLVGRYSDSNNQYRSGIYTDKDYHKTYLTLSKVWTDGSTSHIKAVKTVYFF